MAAPFWFGEHEFPDAIPTYDAWGELPRVLSLEQALARGYSRRAIEHRLAHGRWHRVLPHTYLTGSTLTWTDRCNAALSFAGPDSLLTGAAALADLGLRSVRRPDRLLLLVPRASRVRPAGWVRIRRTDRMPERTLLPGPRRADLARAVADLALERRRLDDVRALVIQAVRANLCTLDELAVQLAEGPRQHSAHLRRALRDAGMGAWSAPEARAAVLLRTANVPPFEANATVVVDGHVLTVDFLWRTLRAVLEIDSDEHHWEQPQDRDKTLRRASLLETGAYTVLSRRPAWIRDNPRQFVIDVQRWLEARAAELAGRT